jgi:SAM-dependent methyltransferase
MSEEIEAAIAALRELEPTLGPDAPTETWSQRATDLTEVLGATPEGLRRLVDELAGTRNAEIASSLAFTLAGAANDRDRARWVAPLAIRAMDRLQVASPWWRLNMGTAIQRLIMFRAVVPELGRPVPGLGRLLIEGMRGNDMVRAVCAVVALQLRYHMMDAVTDDDREVIEAAVLACVDSPNSELADYAQELARERAAPPRRALVAIDGEPGPWNAVATGYDEVWFDALSELTDRAVEIVAPTAGMTILDVGAGPGTFAIRVAPRVARVVAIDFADEMIARLRARAVANVEAHVMDGQALTLEDASFDAAVSMFGWFMFPDRARGLAELRRVLRDGGRVLVTSWGPPDRNLVLGAGMVALREAMPELPRPAGPLPTQLPEVCADELRAAGFADVTATIVRSGMRYPSAAAYWDAMVRGGAPMAALRARLGEAAWPPVAERALAALRARFGDGELALDAEAIFTTGVRR